MLPEEIDIGWRVGRGAELRHDHVLIRHPSLLRPAQMPEYEARRLQRVRWVALAKIEAEKRNQLGMGRFMTRRTGQPAYIEPPGRKILPEVCLDLDQHFRNLARAILWKAVVSFDEIIGISIVAALDELTKNVLITLAVQVTEAFPDDFDDTAVVETDGTQQVYSLANIHQLISKIR